MVLGYWGYADTQEAIAAQVRPGDLDTSVELAELAAYAQAQELAAHTAVNGRGEVLRQLLANGLPIVAARWLTTIEGTGARQFQVVRGYDHASKMFTVHDPLAGPDVTVSYDDMDEEWRATNRSYLLVYPAENEDRVRAILGDEWNASTMWEDALAQAEQELEADAQDATAQLNRASALAALKQCDKAREAFDTAQALGLAEGRLRYRYGRYECLLNLEAYQEVLDLTQAEVDGGAALEELHLYRAQAHVALDDAAMARVEYSRALDIHPGWQPAEEGRSGLPE
jgi:tetratricopeptide (TPR) repeat protein